MCRWPAGVVIAGLFILPFASVSQQVTVRSVTISGNDRTKEAIIHRELTFSVGDTLLQRDLGQILERNRSNLINLALFNEVIVNISEWDTRRHMIDITIDVKESWYIYAVPIIELADRNFNVWWTTYNHSLDRLNLGARLEWLNFSGSNDKVKAKIQVGYTPKQELEYRFPYINRKQSLGATVGFSHSTNKEMSYATVNNREQFIRIDDRKLQEKWKGDVSMTYRPSIFLKYELLLSYQHVTVDKEVVADNNPLFFRQGGHTHDAMTTKLVAEYDDRDLKIFPSKGYRASIEIEKNGLGRRDDENRLTGTLYLEWNFHSGRRLQHRIGAIGQYSLSRSRPSLIYYDALGSRKKYVSGYELYLINGLDAFIGKYQVAARIMEKQIHWRRLMPLEQFRQMPVVVFLTLQAETGYAYDPYTGAENPLSNRWLYGGGPGVSVLLYNNFIFQFNLGINHRGEKGLFVHNRTSF